MYYRTVINNLLNVCQNLFTVTLSLYYALKRGMESLKPFNFISVEQSRKKKGNSNKIKLTEIFSVPFVFTQVL